MIDLDAIESDFARRIDEARSIDDLRSVDKAFLGKSGELKQVRSQLGQLDPAERATIAPQIEQMMARFRDRIDTQIEAAGEQERRDREEREWIDVSLPGLRPPRGGIHPIARLEERCIEILQTFGFEIADGPEVESAYYNFDALNVPPDHPARDLQDTFWLDNGLLLRSHTTPIQARALEQRPELPLKVIARGRVYRNEAVDATHLAMFHQLEGFWVDRGVTAAHMKQVLAALVRGLFGERAFRFKPKFYPYTEPSIGIDIACINCDGEGCSSCHDVGWVTVIGAGMIHPKVLRQFDFDPDEISGFAFGWGTTRLAYQWLGLPKVRDLYSVNVEDLAHYDRLAADPAELGSR